jgi:hypothetical protein
LDVRANAQSEYEESDGRIGTIQEAQTPIQNIRGASIQVRRPKRTVSAADFHAVSSAMILL